MELRRRPRVAIANVEAQVFEGWAPDASMSAGGAPTSAGDAPAPTSPAVVVGTPTPPASPSAGARQHSADTPREEGRPEKRPRVEASPSPPAELSSSAASPQPIGPDP